MERLSDVVGGLLKRQLSDLGNLLGINNHDFGGVLGNTGGQGGFASSGDSSDSDNSPSTVVSVVYVTATTGTSRSPTYFPPPKTVQQTTSQIPTTQGRQTVGIVGTPMQQSPTQTSAQSLKSTNAAATTDRSTKAATATSGSHGTTSLPLTRAQNGVASATQGAQTSAVPTQESTTPGMSGGAKAGIAFGVIAIFALVAGIIFFVARRKRQQKKEEGHNLDDEKTFFAAGAAADNNHNGSNNRAPRLSLRPVTQFLPGIGEPKVTEMSTIPGGFQQPYFGPGPTHASGPVQSRPGTSQSHDSANPFGQNAERLDPAAAEKAALNAPIPVPTFSARSDPRSAPPMPANDPFADKSDARSISPEVTPPNSMPGSPPKAVLATAAAISVPPAPASPKNQPNNVHRVQLDFKPSMDDEIELRAGDVVRVLHEYDDGWALCMRMDRSKQGVAPRTCLSKLPIKPRPAGPPPGMRPIGRPQSPGMRNFSGPPSHGPGNPMYPAPLSPSLPNMRSASGPGPRDGSPQGRMRSHSTTNSLDHGRQGGSPQLHPAAFNSRSPPRDHRRSASMGQLRLDSPTRSIPPRKPVPGQAI